MGLLDLLVSARDAVKIDREELKRRTRGDFGDKASALGLRAADNLVGGFIDNYDSLGEMAATGVNDLATNLYTDPIGTLQSGGEYLQDLVNKSSTPNHPDAPMAAFELASYATGLGGLAPVRASTNTLGANIVKRASEPEVWLTPAQMDAKKILDMRAAGRASEIPDSLFASADQEYLRANHPLPMDYESRMERARKLGYDVDNPYYHSSPNNFAAFDPQKVDIGTHIGSAEQAENRFHHLFDDKSGDYNTVQVVSKAGTKPSYEMPDVGLFNDASVFYNNFERRRMGNDANLDNRMFNDVDQSLHADEYYGDNYVGSPENREMLDQINDAFRRSGYGSIDYLNEAETMFKGKGKMDPEISKRIDANEDEIQRITSDARDRYAANRPKLPDPSDVDAEAKLKAFFEYNDSNPYDSSKQLTPQEIMEINRLKREISELDVPENRQSPYSSIILDPTDLRSKNAMFDPEFVNSADLLSANRSKTGGLLAASASNLAEDIKRAPLVAHHNTSPEGLLHSYENKGIPMPSLAISNPNFPLDNFGEISLMLKPDMIDPKKKGMNVFPADAYTGRQPRGFLELADKDAITQALKEDPNFGHMETYFYDHQDYVDINQAIQFAQYGVKNNILDPKDYNDLMSYGKDVQFEMKAKDAPKAWEEAGVSSYGGTKRMLPPHGDPYTPSGYRKPDVPYTIDEVFKRMKKDKAYTAGAENHQTAARTRALNTDKFKSMEEIQANRDLIQPRGNDMEDVKWGWNSFVDDAIQDLTDKHPDLDYRTAQSVLDDMSAGQDVRWANLSPEELATARALVNSFREEVKGMPTEYFEAKPSTMMQLNDFDAAVVPNNLDELTLDKLRRSGINRLVDYDPEIEGARGEAMRSLNDFTFANRSKTGGLLSVGMGRTDPAKATAIELDPYGFQKSKLTGGQYLSDTDLRYNDYGNLLPRVPRSWEDMLGKYAFPFFGDRTRGGAELLGVNDIDFTSPVVLEGGTDFKRGLANQLNRAIWASKRGRVSTMNNKVNAAAKLFDTDEIYGITGTMAPDGSDFATFTGEALAELAGQAKITKKFAKEFDRKAKKTIDKDFVGLLSPNLRDWVKNADPEQRKSFIRAFDTAPNLAAGLPDPALARYAVNAVDQRDIESSMFGLGASKIDVDAPQLYNFPRGNEYSASQPHSTYDTQLTGDYFGTLPPIPQELLFSDAVTEMLKTLDKNGNIKQKANITHGLKTQLPVEQITQQKIDRIMEYLARMDREKVQGL